PRTQNTRHRKRNHEGQNNFFTNVETQLPVSFIELKESFDLTDVGSLDPRHKGEEDGEWGAAFVKSSSSGFFSSLNRFAVSARRAR
ncbi:hypothetical protein, partial [Pararhizobium sp. PWRC1-1]|uniref:hypothetical protein n=1 Tax=Pararhizobium sp. PWRC1-1 TaxID=2804566 RepID=UPI003CEF0CE2